MLLFYSYRDAVIIKKLGALNVEKELKNIYREIDRRIKKYGGLIEEEIEAYRKTKERYK